MVSDWRGWVAHCVQIAPVKLSMLRTFNFVRPLKSDLWNAFYAVLGGEGFTQTDMDAMIWFVSSSRDVSLVALDQAISID